MVGRAFSLFLSLKACILGFLCYSLGYRDSWGRMHWEATAPEATSELLKSAPQRLACAKTR